jgi:hypothetical protein
MNVVGENTVIQNALHLWFPTSVDFHSSNNNLIIFILYTFLYCHDFGVAINGVWIGEWIY